MNSSFLLEKKRWSKNIYPDAFFFLIYYPIIKNPSKAS